MVKKENMMEFALTSLAHSSNLLDGDLKRRRGRNVDYLMELTTDNLLQAYRHEAGLFKANYRLTDCHWGWDGPLSDLRGQFTGHWLSAAARIICRTSDVLLKHKADFIVSEIAICQRENGGEWGFSIPEKRLHWLVRGKHTWAPQYVCHKSMMGLLDMYRFAGNEQALDVLLKEAAWFHRFTSSISRETMDNMMDWEETGAMMELWADLYAVTGDTAHLELMRRYERPRLFEPLLNGEDILTNMHANTTIPEVHGAARAYEVTGEERYRKIVEAYWDLAVTRRGAYATGGQTSGELWTPMGELKLRLGDKNQEHCVVYNMMRLSEYLLRWTGDSKYADYWEANLINGVLAQTFWQDNKNLDIRCDEPYHDAGLVAYYLGLAAGSQKFWGSKTEHFWCCYGTAVQANAMLHEGNYYLDSEGLVICQYLPSECDFVWRGSQIKIRVVQREGTGHNIRYDQTQRRVQHRPEQNVYEVSIIGNVPADFTVKLRRPSWTTDNWTIEQGGARISPNTTTSGFIKVSGSLSDSALVVSFPRPLRSHALPDDAGTVAFLDGPVVLAGLTESEITLLGDPASPESILEQDNERQWQQWLGNWKTKGQPTNIKFKPLNEIGREKYTVYFPITKD